ncbi:MAG: Y-family DNA polymerase, partial [Sciscionella sp.]
ITPLVEPLSLDEAFLDVSGALRRLGRTPAGIAADIRAAVAEQQGVTCSVGIAATKFVAKLASGMCKPDGMLVVPPPETLNFLHPLPVGAIWGVGARTAERLSAMGLDTVADIAAAPLPRLRRLLGTAGAQHLHRLANGQDDRAVVTGGQEKSIGAEVTFDTDQPDREVLKRELLRLSVRVAGSLRARGLRGRTVSIKARYGDFTTITRSRSVPVATDGTQDIYRVAAALLTESIPPGALRLIGVRVESLGGPEGHGEQLTLGAPDNGWREADAATDAVRARFPSVAVAPAALLGRRDGRGARRTG